MPKPRSKYLLVLLLMIATFVLSSCMYRPRTQEEPEVVSQGRSRVYDLEGETLRIRASGRQLWLRSAKERYKLSLRHNGAILRHAGVITARCQKTNHVRGYDLELNGEVASVLQVKYDAQKQSYYYQTQDNIGEKLVLLQRNPNSLSWERRVARPKAPTQFNTAALYDTVSKPAFESATDTSLPTQLRSIFDQNPSSQVQTLTTLKAMRPLQSGAMVLLQEKELDLATRLLIVGCASAN